MCKCKKEKSIEDKCKECVLSKIKNIIKKTTSKYLQYKLKNNSKNIRIMSPMFDSSSKENLLSEIVYNYEASFECLFIKDQPNSYNITDLILNSTNVSINQGKKFSMDNIIVYKDNLNTNYPYYYEYPFINNPNIYVKFENLCAVSFINDDHSIVPYKIYVEILTTRSFIYYPNSYIYLLICPEPFSIYSLVYYTPDYIYSQLIGLTNSLTLPDGWIYTYYQTKDYYGINCVNKAEMLQDDLGNIYEYVDKILNPEIYNNYLKSK